MSELLKWLVCTLLLREIRKINFSASRKDYKQLASRQFNKFHLGLIRYIVTEWTYPIYSIIWSVGLEE